MTAAVDEAGESVRGTVVALGPGRATVRVTGAVSCARCAAGRGCGAIFLAADKSRLVEIRVPAGAALSVGQPVDLVLAPAELLSAAWLAYGIPLTAILCAALAASVLLPAPVSDAAAVAMVLAGLVSGGWWARRRLREISCPGRFVPALEASTGRPSAHDAD